MKFDMGQRKLYLAALILLIIAIVLVCVWRIWLKDDGDDGEIYVPDATEQASPWGEFRTAEPEVSPDVTDISAGNNVDTVV